MYTRTFLILVAILFIFSTETTADSHLGRYGLQPHRSQLGKKIIQ